MIVYVKYLAQGKHPAMLGYGQYYMDENFDLDTSQVLLYIGIILLP
jgi:hypothetical protein